MLLTVIAATAVLLLQDPGARPYTPAADATRQIYRPPAIRPFETAPGPGVRDVETFFDQGVTAAEASADARAGPLDGRWRALGPDGRPLLSLVLRDAGDGTVEGAWRQGDDGRARLVSAIAVDGSRATLTLDRRGTLRLRRSDGGWRGEFVHNGQARPVTLHRP
ncbi:hypothetical protein [uncultured Brevundimonas sp.]|mgnify:FL=1|uniref:hypothetical protein n=1 Tax=uncultured Brevundimonas sp. TaxID=213418 RepID=UPI0030EE9A19|tara:strand:+ start:706 stop:1197 length:492 start_codon:yes stop_codon:yes gene_type:complete